MCGKLFACFPLPTPSAQEKNLEQEFGFQFLRQDHIFDTPR